MSDYFYSLEYIVLRHGFRGQYGYNDLIELTYAILAIRDEENQ